MELIVLSHAQQMREVAHVILELANDLDRPNRREAIHLAALELERIAERISRPARD